MIGVGREIQNNLPFMHMSLAEVDNSHLRADIQLTVFQINLKFINRYRDTWPAGLQCLAGKILDLAPLVSHTYPLEKSLDALHTCGDLSNGSIKVQIVDEREDVL